MWLYRRVHVLRENGFCRSLPQLAEKPKNHRHSIIGKTLLFSLSSHFMECVCWCCCCYDLLVLLRGKNRLETAPQSLIDFILVTMPVSYHHRWMPFQIGYLSQFIVSRNSFPLGIAVCVVWVIRTLFSLYIFLSHSRTRALSYSLTFGALVVCLFNDRT